MALKIGNGCRYTPDFVAVERVGDNGHVEVRVYEVKGGYAREDAVVKLKAAADRYRWARFFLVVVRERRGAPPTFEVMPVQPSDDSHEVLVWPKIGPMEVRHGLEQGKFLDELR